MAAIWQGRIVRDRTISGAIKALRVALGDLRANKLYVRSIHSRGYRFIADVHMLSAPQQAKTRPTILVRVLRVAPNKAELKHLADGLAEDLMIGLSNDYHRRVLSYNTTRALAEQLPSVNEGVTAFVDGSIR